jgi:hypothetical protein
VLLALCAAAAPALAEEESAADAATDFGAAIAESALELLSAAATAAGQDLGGLLVSSALLAGGALVGGAVSYQLATAAAEARASAAARAATRAALNALDPAALTDVLGELPSWLAYRDFERAGWLNRVIVKAWPYLDLATSGIIVAALAPVLEATRPAFLTSLRFERFSFGSIPARVEGVKVYDVEGEDAVEIDLEVFWKGDPDVVLGVRAAQDAVRVPVSLTELQASGTVRLTFGPLLPKFPCFGAISIALMGPPTLAFDLRVVGGDITLVPGVAVALRNYFKSLLAAYLVWPRRITVAIPGTGYTLRDANAARAAGTLHVRLLGAAGAAAAGGDAGTAAGDAAAVPSALASRLRLGAEAVAQVRWAAPPAAEGEDAVILAAALRGAPPSPLRPGGSLTLPVEDPAAQTLWLAVYDRASEDGGAAPLFGECAVPLALCAAAKEGQTVEIIADLGPPAPSARDAPGAVARRGGVLGWLGAAGGAVAGASTAVTRGTVGAWSESMRAIGRDGWGSVAKLPRAIGSGYMAAAYGGDGAGGTPEAATAAEAGLPAEASRVGRAWVLPAADGAPARVLSPGAGPAGGGALRLEIRYETAGVRQVQPQQQLAAAADAPSNGSNGNGNGLNGAGAYVAAEVSSAAAAADEAPSSAFSVTAAEDDDDVEWNGPRAHAAPASPAAEAPAARAARRLRRLRLAAGAAALALDAPGAAEVPPEARAAMLAMLEQAERLVEREAAQHTRDE